MLLIYNYRLLGFMNGLGVPTGTLCLALRVGLPLLPLVGLLLLSLALRGLLLLERVLDGLLERIIGLLGRTGFGDVLRGLGLGLGSGVFGLAGMLGAGKALCPRGFTCRDFTLEAIAVLLGFLTFLRFTGAAFISFSTTSLL